LMKVELGKSTKRAAELATKYGPRHPDIQKIQAEISDIERQIAMEVTWLVQNLKNEYEVAERRELQLTNNLTALKDQESTSKEATVKLLELQREATSSKQLFEALLGRYKQTSETQELQLPDARIIEQADVPLFPAAPKRKQVVLIALIAGLLAGIAVALIMEFAAPGISRPEEVERILEVAHLASVPEINGPGQASLDPLRPIRMLLAEPRSIFAESVRGIRREIDQRRQTTGPRVILIASSLPGEGSDVIASNLAHHYALTGNRVLLIDGDLRRAPLTRRLAPARTSGLLDVLLHGRPVETAILHDASTGLNFLPAMSPAPLEPACPEMLASKQMAAVIAALKQQFDTIIIESPPLLPVVDGRILADYADQIVFVTTWRRTPKQLAKRALQSLGANHDKIAGVVINRVDPVALEDTHALGTRMTPPEVAHARRAA
jgi:polysaccharide biosynthesis transport protein